jgi:hypothetical protein
VAPEQNAYIKVKELIKRFVTINPYFKRFVRIGIANLELQKGSI